MRCLSIVFLLWLGFMKPNSTAAQITRIWLTHASDDPSRIVVNWYSDRAGSSEVLYWAGDGKEKHLVRLERVHLHHVEIPLDQKDVKYHYRVRTGREQSDYHSFKGYPSAPHPLRVAAVGNWGHPRDLDFSALQEDDPHLLVTLGDNAPNLHGLCGQGTLDCIEPYLQLIDSQPELFQTTPFMPILGNHDREIRPRVRQPPAVAGYDTNATAYRRFFELPGDEWKWTFTLPDHQATFVALDLNHIADYGTTWQTGHAYHRHSPQFDWYQAVMDKHAKPGHQVITLHNEQNYRTRKLVESTWQKMFQQGSMVITGYGYFYERAEVDGFPYFTSSLKAGDQYRDEASKVLLPTPSYLLLTLRAGSPVEVEAKSLDGEVLDRYGGK